jgi:hypothetical protein
MDAAAVALVYDILVTPHPAPGQSKHEVHELKGSAIAIHKIFEGKLAQSDLVVCVFSSSPPSPQAHLFPERAATLPSSNPKLPMILSWRTAS